MASLPLGSQRDGVCSLVGVRVVAGGDRAVLAAKTHGPSTGTSAEALTAEHEKEQGLGAASGSPNSSEGVSS